MKEPKHRGGRSFLEARVSQWSCKETTRTLCTAVSPFLVLVGTVLSLGVTLLLSVAPAPGSSPWWEFVGSVRGGGQDERLMSGFRNGHFSRKTDVTEPHPWRQSPPMCSARAVGVGGCPLTSTLPHSLRDLGQTRPCREASVSMHGMEWLHMGLSGIAGSGSLDLGIE